jgi:nucleoside-diphosphate-sugar epimerase
MKADLLDQEQVYKAVAGSEVVYVTAGLPYNAKYWSENWPKLVSNVLNACKRYQAKLVFFDNIYMYNPDSVGNMTEDAEVNPVSKKGQVRAKVASMIMDEVAKGNLTALIARCADYYGPGIINTSMLYQTVINPLRNGKKANWLGSVKYKHSFTYTPDAGKATALLGNTPDAFNQVWHLPTSDNPLTGKQWIEAFAKEFSVQSKYQVASKFMVRILGLFIPEMKETVELYYQFDRDYIFNSSKFEKRFNFTPTPYEDGIKEIKNSFA